MLAQMTASALLRELTNPNYDPQWDTNERIMALRQYQRQYPRQYPQGYYFNTERHGALWFAYIWREGDDASIAPPVKEFHSLDDDDESVSQQAARWIEEHGIRV